MPPAERQQAGKQFRPASGKGGFAPSKGGFAFRSGRRPVRRAV
jgi:hypothetical protein